MDFMDFLCLEIFCFGWKSLSMGEGERESQTHFWVTRRLFFLRSFKNLRKAT